MKIVIGIKANNQKLKVTHNNIIKPTTTTNALVGTPRTIGGRVQALNNGNTLLSPITCLKNYLHYDYVVQKTVF